MSPIDLTVARLASEEGFRSDVYDDATGQTIPCTGQPTIGYGTRCRQWSKELSEAVMRMLLAQADGQLAGVVSAYRIIDPVRQSVLLDLAYNLGVTGLLTFQKFLTSLAARQYDEAAADLLDSRAARESPARYRRLAGIIMTGIA